MSLYTAFGWAVLDCDISPASRISQRDYHYESCHLIDTTYPSSYVQAAQETCEISPRNYPYAHIYTTAPVRWLRDSAHPTDLWTSSAAIRLSRICSLILHKLNFTHESPKRFKKPFLRLADRQMIEHAGFNPYKSSRNNMSWWSTHFARFQQPLLMRVFHAVSQSYSNNLSGSA